MRLPFGQRNFRGIFGGVAPSGSGGLPPDYEVPDFFYKGSNEIYVSRGRYPHGANMYRHRGQFQDLAGLVDYWDLAANVAVEVDGTYSAGSASGTIGGAIQNNSFLEAYLMDSDGHTLFMPFVYVYDAVLSGSDTVITPAVHSTMKTTWTLNPNTDDSTARANYSFRQAILATDISTSGGKHRIALCGRASGDMYLDHVSIVERSSGSTGTGSFGNYTFGGSASVTISAGTIVYSDWLTFAIDETKDYLITGDFSSTAQNGRWGSLSGQICYYKANADWYDQLSVTPDGNNAYVWLLCDIQVMTADANLVADNDALNDYRVIKHSNDAYAGNIYTILDSASGTPDTITITGDKTDEIHAGDFLQLIPKSSDDFCDIGTLQYGSAVQTAVIKAGDRYQYGSSMSAITCPGTYYKSQSIIASLIPPNARGMIVAAQNQDVTSAHGKWVYFHPFTSSDIASASMINGHYINVTATANRMRFPLETAIETPGKIGISASMIDTGGNIVICAPNAYVLLYPVGWRT